mmetsp:Transcript_56132/g.60758  ORF Transcript_56132/g.60758 Transcript_56132/m.60758 type:complete len:276 (-) Transcript_56132:374-1201(-)
MVKKMVQFLLVFLLSFCIFCSCCHGFMLDTKNNHLQQRNRPDGMSSSSSSSSSTTTILRVIPLEIAVEVGVSRSQFFLWFIGSLGGVGVGISSVPRLWGASQYINSLKGSPSLGGENLGLSTLALFLTRYPEDLSIKDLEKIVNNPMTVTQITENFRIEGNFLSTKGYLTFRAFEQANSEANPLAVRAVFDTFAQSQDTCEPYVAQEKIDSYKEDIGLIKNALLKSKIIGYSSIFTLLLLLGIAESIAVQGAIGGWIPGWNFREDGILNIPQYWI